MISSNCISVDAVIKTPEYKEFRQHYPDYNDGFLVDAVQAYREKYRRDKMDEVAYYPTTSQQFSAFTTYIKRKYLSDARQSQNAEMDEEKLLDTYTTMNKAFTPRIRRFRVDMIVHDVLDKIKDILRTDSTMTVRQAIKTAGGYKRLVTSVFQDYQELTDPQFWMENLSSGEFEEGTEGYERELEEAKRRADEFKLVLENKDRLAAMVAPALSDILGTKISATGHVMEIDLNEDPFVVAPAADEPQMGYDPEGDENSENAEAKGDRYVDYRIQKIEKTLTETVKLFLSGIPLLDENGEQLTDDLGYGLYMTYQQAAYALKEEFETVDADDFMATLNDLTDKYPWLNALVTELQGNVPMQAVFYTTFKAYESIYKAVYARKGKYITDNMNARSNKRSVMQETGANGIAGRILNKQYSIYNGGGYLTVTKEKADKVREELKSLLGVARLVRMSTTPAEWSEGYVQKRKEKYPWIEETGVKSMDMFLASEGAEEWLDTIKNAARGIGMNLTKENLRSMARKKINKKSARFLNGNNRLVAFVDALSSFYKAAADAHDKGEDMNYLYSAASDELKTMTDALAPVMKKETDRRSQVGETSYATWNVGGFLRQLTAKLFNKGNMSRSFEVNGEVDDEGNYKQQTIDGDYEKWLFDNFLKFENFILKATGKPIGWLKDMYNDREFSKSRKFELQTQLEFMGVPYDKLSDDQRRIAPFVMWYNQNKGKKSGTYAVMIQADYTNAWDYIKAPIYQATIPVDKKLASKLLGEVDDEELESYVKELEEKYGTEIHQLSQKFTLPDGKTTKTVYADIVDRYADEVLLEYERIVRLEEREGTEHTKLKNYEEKGKNFLVFPALNHNGFREEYEKRCEDDPTGARAMKFVRDSVVSQLEDVIQKDVAEFVSGEVPYNPYLPKTKEDEMFEGDGKKRQLTEWGYNLLRNFSVNDYYARVQMANIFFGGSAFFPSIAEFEKRSMLLHGPRSAMYTPAGKKLENVAYIRDDKTGSAFLAEIKEMAEAALDRKLISPKLMDRLIRSYESIKATDGEGFRTLESHRQFRMMNPTIQWTSAHEEAYQRIMNGDAQEGDLDLVMDDMLDDAYNSVQKPFCSGWEEVHNADGSITRVPLIQKYSEAVLLPPTLLGKNFAQQSAPVRSFTLLNKMLEAAGKEQIDLFLFESNVKIEPFSVLDPMEIDKETGERKYKTAEEMASYMYDTIMADGTHVHKIDYRFVGVAASLQPHVEDQEIAFSSQAEKQAKANITDSEEIKIPGRILSGKQARDLYDQIEEAIIIDSHQETASELRDPNKIKDILQDGLAEKSYNSADMASALTPVRKGKGNSRFAVPLFTPSLEHGASELLNSIVKNRLSKVKTKGANVVQVSGIGMDQQAVPFTDGNFIKDDRDRLGIEFEYRDREKKKGVKRIKWIDCYIAIPDSRLEAYADPDGSIPPAKLRKLVRDGVIDERTLMFVAYRTPSDAEHSILPLRIKGFLPKSSGANIIISKEAMVMTGHDYDGDKLRCHFQDFRTTLDIDRLRRDYKKNPTWADARYLEDLFGEELKGVPSDGYIEESDFIDRVKHLGKKNQFKKNYMSTHLIEYNFAEKDDEGNKVTPYTGKNTDPKARRNALVQILFGALTSESGSMRILIPGGAMEHDEIAKTFYITKSIVNPGVLDILKKHGLSADATLKDVTKIYHYIMGLTAKKRDAIIDEMSSLESPFSYAHQVRAYRNMMTGTEMTGIYAMYSSTAALLQSLDLHYIPKPRLKGAVNLRLFGKKIDKLFDVRYGDQGLQLLIYAELVNAAVDNGKNPILGFINQTPELASLTFMLYAMGLSAEQIHLVLNQPAVVELQRRLDSQDSKGLGIELNNLIEENKDRVIEPSKDDKQNFYSRRRAIREIAMAKKDQYIAGLPADFSAIKNKAQMKFQLSVLCVLDEIRGAAEQLTELVHIIRPEARANGVGPTNAKTLSRLQKLDDFKALVTGSDEDISERLRDTESEEEEEEGEVDPEVGENEEGEETKETAPLKGRNGAIRIAGMENLFRNRDIHEGMESEKIFEEIEKGAEDGGQLRQAVALHELLMRWTADFMSNYFPMMKPEWRKLIVQLAGEYDYKSIQEGTIQKIAEDMVLYALLDSPKYKRHLEDKRTDLVIKLPERVEELKKRIEDAKKEDSTDEVAKELADNMFLAKLDIRKIEGVENASRIFFDAGGPVIGDMAEDIRQDWSDMLSSPNKEVRQMAIDLFEYNMFTSGFGYGRYEFAHLAPLDVILDTPNYVDALYSVMEYDFGGTFDNFRHQYYMNHWGEKRLVPQIDASMLGASALKALKRAGTVSSDEKAVQAADLQGHLYVAVKDADGNFTLYRNISGAVDSDTVEFEEAQKLGVRNSHGQISVQYSPQLNYRDINPIQKGNDSNWADARMVSKNSAYWKKINQKRKTEREAQMKGASESVAATADKRSASRKAFDSMFGSGRARATTEAANAARAEATERNEETEKVVKRGKVPPLSVLFYLAKRKGDDVTIERVPGTPANIREARRQKAYVILDHRLRELVKQMGYSVGAITSAELRAGVGGVTDLDAAKVVANELIEAIRVADGYIGQEALPEEVAHLSLELLGHDHVLVRRLLDTLRRSPEAVREAYGDLYEEYMEVYDNNPEAVLIEAAGKLVAKQMLRQQRIESSMAYRIVARVVDAIKWMLRKIPIRRVQDAIYDADEVASRLARNLLSGQLLDSMDRANISVTGEMFSKTRKDISKDNDIVSKILKHDMKLLELLKARLGYHAENDESVAALEKQIAELKKSVNNHKTESAILSFLGSSLDFLNEVESDLNNAVDNALGAGVICKQLSISIDTLHGFANVVEAIKEAINDGEISKNEKLEEKIDLIEKGITKFFDKCNALGMDYFEDFLSEVYGSAGITQTVGRDKGRVFSIREIARKGDRDVSLFSRWVHSASDCNDFILKAVAERVRRAKWNAREKTMVIKSQIDAAYADLKRETGSSDQTFMFQYKTVDGKRVKTGKYITKKAAQNLPAAQRKFYNRMMDIKEQADKLLPESKVSLRKIVMLRKLAIEKAGDSSSLGEKGKYIWESIRDKVLDMSDDALLDTFEVKMDFEGSRVDRLPVLYTEKSKKESYDDMTDDVATSIMAYVGMANEYSELDSISGMIENAKRVSARRDIGQRTGARKQQETIADDTQIFHQPYTVKQAKTKIQQVLEDYLSMHFYGHVQKNEGTIPGTRLSTRGLVNAANNAASLSQMALNLPQRIANITVGQAQIIIESAAKGMFSAKDVAWGAKEYAKYSADRLMDTGKIDTDNKLSLFIDHFDLAQDNRRSFKQNKYGRARYKNVFNSHLLYAGLTIGEDYLSTVSGLSLAHRFKVKARNDAGQLVEMNLFEAYKVSYADPVHKTGAYLELRPDAVKMDGTPITKDDEYRFMKNVAGLNFDMQGIYNLDDRSAMQQYAGGALVIMYRKWIAPALKRRYAGAHYDALREQWEEGYWMTSFNYIYDVIQSIKKDGEAMKNSILLNWDKLNDYEKTNIRKAATELLILVGTTISASAAWMLSEHGPDEDDAELSWIEKQFVYQALRLRNELGSMAPTPMLVQEAGKILKSPFAAARPIAAALDGLNLLVPTNYITEVKSGKYKGHTKAYKYFRDLPIVSMFGHWSKFVNPDASIRYYKNPVY